MEERERKKHLTNLTKHTSSYIIYVNIYEGCHMQQISISEIQRNLHKLDDFDIIEIIDKKRNKIKGYFIESKYASFVEELSSKVASKQQKSISLRGVLHSYANANKIESEKEAWKIHTLKKYSIDD